MKTETRKKFRCMFPSMHIFQKCRSLREEPEGDEAFLLVLQRDALLKLFREVPPLRQKQERENFSSMLLKDMNFQKRMQNL